MLLDILGNLVYILDCLSFSMRNILYLRLLAILSAAVGVSYYYFQIIPLWINISWNSMYICINSVQVFLLYREKRPIFFHSEWDNWLYRDIFKILSPGEYRKLRNLVTKIHLKPDEIFIHEGEQVDSLSIVYSGILEVLVNNVSLALCKQGDFLGEMSFLSGKPASATIRAVSDSICIIVKKTELQKLLNRYPHINDKLNIIFGTNLASKLTRQ